MIRVNPAEEPETFDTKVRQPGQAFLGGWPAGKKVDFRGREYWRRSLDDLHQSYGGICAYTCHFIPLDTGGDTVEHFISRNSNSALAYEWDNFRFVCNRMNGRKGKYTDVVDPFSVVNGMFELQFPSLQIDVGTLMAGANKTLAASTIKRLKLNAERNVKARLKFVTDFRDEEISVGYLSRHAPFIHSEMARLGISRADLKILLKARS